MDQQPVDPQPVRGGGAAAAAAPRTRRPRAAPPRPPSPATATTWRRRPAAPAAGDGLAAGRRRRGGPARTAASSAELSSRRSRRGTCDGRRPGRPRSRRPTAARWSATEPVSGGDAAGRQGHHDLGARPATRSATARAAARRPSVTLGRGRAVPGEQSSRTASRHSGASAKTRVRPRRAASVGGIRPRDPNAPPGHILRGSRTCTCAAQQRRSPSRPSRADGPPRERRRAARPGTPSTGRTAPRPGRRGTPAAAPSGSARRGCRRA